MAFLLAVVVAPRASAEPNVEPAVGAGPGLWMVDGDGEEPWLAPQVSTEVHLRVAGLIARARVEQLFENPSEEAVEAVYVFPLPETAAVDGVTLQVGSRKLSGGLRERALAARQFEGAARAGRVATLVSQERPDVFTTRVANIPPGARVAVTLTYHELVGNEHGVLSLGVPSTLTPRYVAGAGELGDGAEGGSAEQRAAGPLAPPVSLDGSGPLFDVLVELERGVELGAVESPSHELELSRRAGGVEVRLREGPVLADRDFRLRWRPAPGEPSRSSAVIEDAHGARYLLAALLPPFERSLAPHRASGAPAPEPLAPVAARDITFLVDTSRSMAGSPLTLAMAVLRTELSLLTPLDHFNVIEIGSAPRLLFEASRPASALNVAEALERVARLRAVGDTALAPALELALNAPTHPERSQRVALISDGAIGDEQPLFRLIEARLGSRRLFTIGVGPAPGRYALRGAARAGRGTFTAIAALGEVSSRVAELDAALGAPTLEGLALLAPSGARTRLAGQLYAGEPLLLLARLGSNAAGVTLTATRAGEPWRHELALSGATPAGQIERLWARAELDALGDGADPEAQGPNAPALLALARERGLVSTRTSFVAVDAERSVEDRASSTAVPLALPAGSEMFGRLPPRVQPQGPTCSGGRRAASRPGIVAARAHVQCGLSG